MTITVLFKKRDVKDTYSNNMRVKWLLADILHRSGYHDAPRISSFNTGTTMTVTVAFKTTLPESDRPKMTERLIGQLQKNRLLAYEGFTFEVLSAVPGGKK